MVVLNWNVDYDFEDLYGDVEMDNADHETIYSVFSGEDDSFNYELIANIDYVDGFKFTGFEEDNDGNLVCSCGGVMTYEETNGWDESETEAWTHYCEKCGTTWTVVVKEDELVAVEV
jgi:Zn finger protein HypA/HybF involved in hydrogenase expression